MPGAVNVYLPSLSGSGSGLGLWPPGCAAAEAAMASNAQEYFIFGCDLGPRLRVTVEQSSQEPAPLIIYM